MRKGIKIFLVFLFVIGTCFIINYSLFKPSKINFFITNRFYGSPANNAFTDENFYKCVIDAYNSKNKTNLSYTTNLSDEQLASITRLSCSGYGKSNESKIKNVNGIEKIVNLEELNISDNQLTSLDVSQNVALTELDAHRNQLASLNINGASALKALYVSDNQLTSLDVSQNSYLIALGADNNQLSSLDISHNPTLKNLWVYSNQLTSLDVSQNSSLTKLNASDNQLTSLNINNLNLKELNISENQLTNLDLSNSTALELLYVNDNQLTSLDVSHNPLLIDLAASSNQLTSLIINNPNLNNLSISSNQLTSLDVSDAPLLEMLHANGNRLANLTTNNPNLKHMYIHENQLTSLDVINNPSLEVLDVGFNPLTNININNPNLVDLNAPGCSFRDLDVSNAPLLDTLDVRYNKLVSLDVSQNLELRILLASNQERYVYIYGNDFSNVNDPILLDLVNQNGEYEESYAGNYDVYLSYNDTIKTLDFTYKILRAKISSDKYQIFEIPKNYIYTKIDIDNETILNNINLSGIKSATGIIENNKYIIKRNDEIIKEFDLINISSDKYDLTKDYIFDENEDILSNINVLNGDKVINDNKIQIKKGEDILQEFDYVTATSDKYDLSLDKMIVIDNNIESLISNIICINCSVKIKNNDKYKTGGGFTDGDSLVIMYNDEILKEYELSYAVSGVSLNNNDLKLNLDKKKTFKLEATVLPTTAENKNVTWESSDPSVASVDNNGLVTANSLGDATITVKTEEGELTAECNVSVVEIPTYTVTYPDNSTQEYEENEKIIFKSDLTKEGYKLVGYKYNNKDYKLTDELLMPDHDITLEAIWELVIPDATNNNKYIIEDNYFKNINLETNINNLDLGLDSIYNVKITKDNKEKTNGLIGTGDVINIYFEDTLVTNYTVIIKGDVTGNGKVLIGDVSRAYQYLKKKISMEDCYVKAADVGQVDGVIKVGDISKLYQYLKGKIKEL